MTADEIRLCKEMFSESLELGLSKFTLDELNLIFAYRDRVVNPRPTKEELCEFELKLRNLNNNDDTSSKESLDTAFFLDIKNKYYTLYDYIINGYETFTGVRYPNILDITLLIETDLSSFLDLGNHIFNLDKERHYFENIYLEVINYINDIKKLKIIALDEVSYKEKENIIYFLKDKNIELNQNTFNSAVNMFLRGEFSFENYKLNA